MIFTDRPGFVMSRNGFILVTNELRTVTFSGYLKYGSEYLTTPDIHFFPLANNIDMLVNCELRFATAEQIYKYISHLHVSISRKRSEATKKPVTRLINALTLQYKEMHNRLTSNKIENKFIGIKKDGRLIEGVITYNSVESDDKEMLTLNRTIRINDMPMGVGSEWVVCYDADNTSMLEAAMRSTNTNEELLALLRKTGAINVGRWVTLSDYVKEANVYENMKKITQKIKSDFFNNLADMIVS